MITACLIVKNEEKWIEGCLNSLRPLASQIVVADTGSTDRTIEILQQLPGIEFFQIAWEKDFAKARNATIEKARCPWILSFDADEKIALKDIEAFRAAIKNADADSAIEAISLIRRDYVENPQISGFRPCAGEYAAEEGVYPGYYVERMTRIFRNRPHIRWKGRVHELVDPQLKGKVVETSLIFHHYGYLNDEEKKRQKSLLYQEFGKQKIQEDPAHWKPHYDLACEYVQNGQWAEAIASFEAAAALAPREISILNNWGYALMEKGDYLRAEETLTHSLRLAPKNHDALLNLSVVLMRTQRLAACLEICTTLTAEHPLSFLGHRNRGLCLLHLRRFQEAANSLQRAIQIYPGFVDAECDLAALYLMCQNRPLAERQLASILQKDPQNFRAKEMAQHLRL